MIKLQEWKLRLAQVKEFFPRISKKGSPTMEYVIIIAVGAIFAGILLSIFQEDDGDIKGTLIEKVKTQIEGK
ncbi:hypothetical protein [Laceyella putida]|uniref:Uncharacterized protein n=1 Tax=Laceyella putida TaxID=110101 RepID=A0ABW2RQV1_9BACL